MKYLFLEPYFGGSHKEFALGLAARSSHEIDLMPLPDSNWGWRMKGAALHYSRFARSLEAYDGIIATDLMRLSDLKATVGTRLPPVLLYFHENQITYPLAPGEKRDMNLCMTDITSALCADRVLFNSHFHRDAFINALPDLLNRMPDYSPDWIVDAVSMKSGVIHPGCNFPGRREALQDNSGEPPLIIWNHRWGFDKNAASFFYALDEMVKRDLDFRVAFLGENFGRIPHAFEDARKRYGYRVVQFGYVESQKAYIDWLRRGKLVVSTAKQENFGISMVEAMRYGCLPLLPARLSYPEILPEPFHEAHLYRNQKEFIAKLSGLISWETGYEEHREAISKAMDRFTWDSLIPSYDRELKQLASLRRMPF